MKPPGRSLRSLLVPGAGAIVPGAANALAARIIERSGYPAVFVTGAGIANSFLGTPDIGLLSVVELAEHVGAIRDSVSLPIIADADTGFGNALNVGRTVRLLERAGADCVMLEDQTFPKRCGHFEGKEVIACAEMVQKIRAAVDARRDDALLILARTDARAVEGFAAAIERINAYREAGADLLFLEAPESAAELASIPRLAPGAHVCNMVIGGKTPLLARQELAGMGYAAIIYANAALQASMRAMQRVLEHIRDHGSIAGVEDAIMPFAERQKVVDHARYKDLETKYSTGRSDRS